MLGLDRRTFALPLIAVAVFVLWSVVGPAVNGAVAADDPVRPGDALIIGPGTTLAPPVGWGVFDGLRTSDDVRSRSNANARTLISGDGISVSTQTGSFAGDARALLRQVANNDTKISADSAFTVEGSSSTVSVDGRRGVAQEFRTLTGEGAIFAFASDGRGIAIVITGTEDSLNRATTTVGRMIASIDFDVRGVA